MGLDMYLKEVKDFESIEWATDHEKEKENRYDKQVILKFKDGTEKQIFAYNLYGLNLVNGNTLSICGVEDITEDKLLVKIWNINAQEGEEHTLQMEVPFNIIKSVPYECAYWRKANQIHAWFVDNVQDGEDDCGSYEVSGEQLLELVELCKEVLEKRTKDFSEATLPTCAGFFFGSYEYDDYYYEDIENTINQLQNVKPNDTFTYSSSW